MESKRPPIKIHLPNPVARHVAAPTLGSEHLAEIQYSIFYKFMAGTGTKRLSHKYSRPLFEIEQIIRQQMQAKPKWTYSQYRAALKKNGVIWAIVTPDGRNALPAHKAYELLCALNAPNDQAHPTAAKASVGGTENL